MQRDKPSKRVLFWSIVTIYTLMLHEAIIVYNAIATRFSNAVASKIPLVIILVAGMAYIVFVLSKKHIKSIGYFIPCVMIVYCIFLLEPNANKRIHIPEYILMTWLLYPAVSVDYRGKGMLLLIILCACTLGVIDELLQGIHPDRYYGWQDICINSASCVAGILTIIGVKPPQQGNYNWISALKAYKEMLLLICAGAAGACFTCICLFYVKETGDFWKAYPVWLVVWNGLFIVATPFAFYAGFHRRINPQPVQGKYTATDHKADMITAKLWLFLSLALLTVIHVIAMFVAVSGVTFR